MKTYRLKNDDRWNYGIRITPDYRTFHGKMLNIFFFKHASTEPCEVFRIKKGFWFEIAWLFKIDRWWTWTFRTKNIYKSKPLSQITDK